MKTGGPVAGVVGEESAVEAGAGSTDATDTSARPVSGSRATVRSPSAACSAVGPIARDCRTSAGSDPTGRSDSTAARPSSCTNHRRRREAVGSGVGLGVGLGDGLAEGEGVGEGTGTARGAGMAFAGRGSAVDCSEMPQEVNEATRATPTTAARMRRPGVMSPPR